MASNQRENERRERKERKKNKRRAIIWAVLIVIIVGIAALKISEIDFKGLFDSVGESSGISESVSDGSKFPYHFSGGGEAHLAVIGNKIAILNDSVYTVINSSNAQEKIKDEHGYANPILRVSGGYSVLFDQGANIYRLDSATENVYENSIDGDILCADVSDTGVVAVATVSGIQKSRVTVYGKSFNERMNYDIGGGYITGIAISDNSRYVAFIVMNSENAKIKSTLYVMPVGYNEPKVKFEYTGSLILDIHFASNDLYVVGNDFVSVIDSLEKEIPVYAQGSINTVAYCYNPSDNLIIAFGEYAGAPDNTISFVKPSGEIKSQAQISSQIKDVTASGTEMTALTGGEIISFKMRNGKETLRLPVDDSYSEIRQMSSKIFGLRSSGLELIN
ncbi:MAG: hypothetical protein J1E05_03350 [Eubacterium sp.]|nr:hypothetical protein [Eubacterium sp.]